MEDLLLPFESAVQFVGWVAVPSAAWKPQRTAANRKSTTMHAEVKNSKRKNPRHTNCSSLIHPPVM